MRKRFKKKGGGEEKPSRTKKRKVKRQSSPTFLSFFKNMNT
jgi:hypothetical protein